MGKTIFNGIVATVVFLGTLLVCALLALALGSILSYPLVWIWGGIRVITMLQTATTLFIVEIVLLLLFFTLLIKSSKKGEQKCH